ncbi:hypothetical protein [Bifidobacterium favimelis]|uniref:Lipoprotein n=1 Tax=Bifidobacterium favimelis TaxID=3122979 RepID=A0ABU8ZNQ9_9BIFI
MAIRYKVRCAGVTALLVAAVALAGCAGGAQAQSFEQEKQQAEHIEPFVDDMKEALKGKDLSPLERDVFTRAAKTGRIEASDYEEAHNRYLECMTNAGFDEHDAKMPDGVYKSAEKVGADFDGHAWFKQSKSCSEHTTMRIEGYYREQQDNPERYKDIGIVAVQCLRDSKIVGDDYTAARFNEGLEQLRKEDSDPEEALGYSLSSDKGAQARYCTSLGGLDIGVDKAAAK